MEHPLTQAVILAAGKGTRMLPLSASVPKPLQVVAGKNLLEWKLDLLPPNVSDVVMVIGHMREQIRDYFGDAYKGRRILYAYQDELNGTMGALLAAREHLEERFLVMMGDDLYAKEDLARMAREEWAVLVKEIKNKEMGGEILADLDGSFLGIDEPKHFVKRGLVNTGLYALKKEFLDVPPVLIGRSSTEFGLPHTLAHLARRTRIKLIQATTWVQISTPDDLALAENLLV